MFSSIVMFQNGAGGAIVGGVGTVIAGIVFGIAGIFSFGKLIRQGALSIGTIDRASICLSALVLSLSLFGVFAPTVAMYCMCTAGIFAYVPTIIKIGRLPQSENALSYAASVVGRSLSLLTASSYSMDAIYPVVAWIATEAIVFSVIVVCRNRCRVSNLPSRVLFTLPGSGKSVLASNQPHKFIDLETHDYEWLEDHLADEADKTIIPWSIENGGNPEWPWNYLSAIKSELERRGDIVLLLTYRDDIASLLSQNNINFTLVIPAMDDKNTYHNRYLKRGNTWEFVEYLDDIWSQTIDVMEKDGHEKIYLAQGEFLQQVFEDKSLSQNVRVVMPRRGRPIRTPRKAA
ncbi:MAG: hypothetical protein LBI64_01410 [Coriobacteriales bacterium]|nr:hypothetical protein [Coriobacteriales bacterium]